MKTRKLTILGILLMVACFVSCTKSNNDNNAENSKVKVTTYTPTDITSISASCGGDVIINSGDAATELGVCWSTLANPTVADSKLSTAVCDAPYVCTVSGLTPGTTYHVRAYAKQGSDYYYGDDKSFTTEEDNGNNYATLLKGNWHRTWIEDGYDWEEYLRFEVNDTPGFTNYGYQNSEYGVWARGWYELSGETITCDYREVSVYVNPQGDEGTMHGFTSWEPKTVTYTIQSCTSNKLVVKESIYGKTLTVTKY